VVGFVIAIYLTGGLYARVLDRGIVSLGVGLIVSFVISLCVSLIVSLVISLVISLVVSLGWSWLLFFGLREVVRDEVPAKSMSKQGRQAGRSQTYRHLCPYRSKRRK
jgi:hypothetical protein